MDGLQAAEGRRETATIPPASQPLKILYHHRVLSRDGQTVHIEELIAALRGQGHEVVVAAPAGFAAADFGADAGLVALLKKSLPAALYTLLELSYNVTAYRRLRRLHRGFKPDVIYERYNLHLVAGVLLRRLTGTPLLLEVNAPLAEERAKFGGLGLPRLAARVERWIWRGADRALPVTAVLAGRVRQAGVPAERILVVHNGIDAERFLAASDTAAAKAALGLAGKTVLGFTGFMRDWHGLDAIVELLARPETPPELHLLLVGDGPARESLERQAAALGVASRVTFAGLVERAAILRFLAAFDVALQPRSVDYASPLKLFEYMAAGKAIVAPDQANLREVLEPEVTALLFDPARPATLAAAVLRLAREPELRQRLGAAARRAITDQGFTWQHNAERVATLASSLALPVPAQR